MQDFLKELNGGRRGAFSDWLAARQMSGGAPPRVAWYPSAGEDFLDLYFLSPGYRDVDRPLRREPAAPELFIHTDIFSNNESRLFDNALLFQKPELGMQVNIVAFQELPRLNQLPFHQELFQFEPAPASRGRVVFSLLDVLGDGIGCHRCGLIYAFVENAAFCANILHRHQAQVSYIVQVRYGFGLGGAAVGPGWVTRQLNPLGCEVFVSDPAYEADAGSERVFELFPELNHPAPNIGEWQRLRTVRWPRTEIDDDVSWYAAP